MHLLLLPGMSFDNKSWIDRVARSLEHVFSQRMVLYYDHWCAGTVSASLDFDIELSKLANLVWNMQHYALFAKSAGVLLAMRGIYEGILAPAFCVFVGSALRFGLSADFPVGIWFTHYSIPTLFIQKEYDPAYSVTELLAFLYAYDVSCYRVVTLAGHDHVYDNIPQLVTLIEEFYDFGDLDLRAC